MDVILNADAEVHAENTSLYVAKETKVDNADDNRCHEIPISGGLPFAEECELWCNCTD